MQANAPSVLIGQALMTRRPLFIALLFGLVIASILVVFWPTTLSMIETWRQSSTYSHGYMVIPVAISMAWRETTAGR